ncbi:MAG: rhodanese-like domain-containing protein [Chlorobi bacterium]|nr:rhodanese-like domain-containing protein [Chlorobiota bacterium]
MNKNYIYLTLLMLILSGGLFFLPDRDNTKYSNPEDLMWSIVQPTRFVSTDAVAKMIIENDPSLELIDVRASDEYDEFTLQNAINIPLDSLISDSYQDYLGIDGMNTVFFSNDDIKADQAWVIAKRLGFGNVYVMKGGLNCWMSTIIKPVEPEQTASSEEFELYSIRKGASIYFTGNNIESSSDSKKTTISIARKKKQSVAEGGC